MPKKVPRSAARTPGRPRLVNQVLVNRMVALREQGFSHREIAQKVERSERTARRYTSEYARQLPDRRNEFVRIFLELVTRPDGSHVIVNWPNPWTHSDRARMHECRFPSEDDHVLRTALRDQRTTIFSEEERMLRAHPCILRRFNVVISAP